MKISIVTISYNQAPYLGQCIESILSQNYRNLEYIVVDPGSTDGSRSIITSYPQIQCLFEPDNGPAEGLRKGLRIASGDILGFINADDYLLPGSLRVIANSFLDNHHSFMSGSGYSLINNKLHYIKPSLLTRKSLLYRYATLFQQSTFFTRDAYEKSGGINADNQTCWDYELYLDILASGFSHAIISSPLGVFRVHNQSITGSQRMQSNYKEDLSRIFFKHAGHEYRSKELVASLLYKAMQKVSSVNSGFFLGH